VDRSKEGGRRDGVRVAPTDARRDPPARPRAPSATPGPARAAAAHETMHLCRLTRPWTCDHCQRLIGRNELAQVHVKAGIRHNLVYHDTCEPVRHADG
jgi:hypothetical protein